MNLNQFLTQTENDEIKNWINTVLKNDMEKNGYLTVGQIEHIIDYFHARKKAYDKKKKSFNLKKMSVEQATTLAEKWVKTLKKKGQDIVETESDVKEVMNFNNGVRLVKLISKDSYLREGNLMSHCVASYHGKDVDIYSLRDSKNMPHCTIEVVSNKVKVNQIKGKGNGSIHPKYIKYVLKILTHLGMEIKKSEFSYLGYREINSDVFNFYNTKFKDFKYMSYQNSIFMYVNQNFKVK